jgi:hypothetical protein
MSIASRCTFCFILLVGLSVFSFGQSNPTINDPAVTAALANAVPDATVRTPVAVEGVQQGSLSNIIFDARTGAVTGGSPVGLSANTQSSSTPQSENDDHFNIDHRRANNSTIDEVDTMATFSGAFVAQAGPSSGLLFRFTMVGNDPKLGGTTIVPTNVDEVSLQLLNADGTVFTTVPFAPFEKVTLESPNFEPLDYRSGHNIEYGDAVHRAQFFNVMKNDWHTLLLPKVVNKVTFTIPFFVNVQLSNGTIVQARSYFTGTAADGSTFIFMLQPLFNFLFDNEVVNEINLGNFTTKGMNLMMFPNTYLFSLNVTNPNLPGGCCVLGFHTFFRGPGFPESRWITQYVSWISPGFFRAGIQDVTALSHELAETFGNPFGANAAPNWQFPGEPANAKVCQANLEEGDPIEHLSNATAAIEVKERGFQFLYHPQNIPLLQWFEMGATSSAIDGAFSFPDETVLPHSALPCPQ